MIVKEVKALDDLVTTQYGDQTCFILKLFSRGLALLARLFYREDPTIAFARHLVHFCFGSPTDLLDLIVIVLVPRASVLHLNGLLHDGNDLTMRSQAIHLNPVIFDERDKAHQRVVSLRFVGKFSEFRTGLI